MPKRQFNYQGYSKISVFLNDTVEGWDTEIFDLELNPNYKQYNFKYYPVSIINRDNFWK